MHVVLLGVIREAFNPMHDGVVRALYIDCVVDDIARMRHPLATYHELVIDGLPERVSRLTMEASQTRAPFSMAEHRALHFVLLD
jgi:hypothetical protein